MGKVGGERNTTPANCANTVVLPQLIEKAELTQGVSVLADKGYCSKKNSTCLLERGLIDGIMLKAQKGMKLTERQRELNNCISKNALFHRAYLWEYPKVVFRRAMSLPRA